MSFGGGSQQTQAPPPVPDPAPTPASFASSAVQATGSNYRKTQTGGISSTIVGGAYGAEQSSKPKAAKQSLLGG